MANTEGCVHYIIAKDIKDYIEKKIFMLEDGFCIHLTKKEIEHLNELKTEISVDNYALSIIMSR